MRSRDKNRKSVNIGLKELFVIEPKTENQKKIFDHYNNGMDLFIHGSAGTGKTFLALFLTLRDFVFKNTQHRKIIIIRSLVPSRDCGFLPGSLEEKALVYEEPYKQICNSLFGKGDAYEILKTKGVIEFVTTSYLRGLTFDDSIVIMDEIQNFSDQEINTCMTRVGENTKIIMCGDTSQSDFKRDKEKEGISNIKSIIGLMPSFKSVYMRSDDIVRSEKVKAYIKARDTLGLN